MEEPTAPGNGAAPADEDERVCTIARVLGIVGDKWTLRILCEAALNGVSRFTDFQELLGIATDILAQRLNKLVDEGLLTKQSYKEPGRRSRFRYELTQAGEEMRLVLAAPGGAEAEHRDHGFVEAVGRAVRASRCRRRCRGRCAIHDVSSSRPRSVERKSVSTATSRPPVRSWSSTSVKVGEKRRLPRTRVPDEMCDMPSSLRRNRDRCRWVLAWKNQVWVDSGICAKGTRVARKCRVSNFFDGA
ncbi:helix-turn-helix transcriptional regulator [Pseudonocardia sp. RS11V-5]|uniref:winged helix-turn-helix transcriptional regulator n=1 Tax=Pseudonocardia terrae TaxID=2905831 RepID=UPI001E370D26|nr:helix-turn-helix domain-containing protein [Pseudonocardia terrae]MCE3556042.1 helix-turn-helix transcriptional regulator [Pseudonocardia terrae]